GGSFTGATTPWGQAVGLNDHPYRIVGVESPFFFGTRPGFNPDLWIPMGMVEQIAGDTAPSRNSNYVELMLRVRSGSSTTENESRLTTAYQAWMRRTSTAAAPT